MRGVGDFGVGDAKEEEAIQRAGKGAIVNVFAGIPAATVSEIDLDALIENAMVNIAMDGPSMVKTKRTFRVRKKKVGKMFAKPGQVYAVYLPPGGSAATELWLPAAEYTVRWYDPRNGLCSPADSYSTEGRHTFVAPSSGDDNDWVLVLDDASRSFGPPGSAD